MRPRAYTKAQSRERKQVRGGQTNKSSSSAAAVVELDERRRWNRPYVNRAEKGWLAECARARDIASENRATGRVVVVVVGMRTRTCILCPTDYSRPKTMHKVISRRARARTFVLDVDAVRPAAP